MVTGHMTSNAGGFCIGGGGGLPTGLGGQQTPPPELEKRVVCILLECFLFYDILTGPGGGHGPLAPGSATDQTFCRI